MSNDYPLYSAIIDGVEVATVGPDDDARMVCGGKKLNSSTKKVPTNVKRKNWGDYT